MEKMAEKRAKVFYIALGILLIAVFCFILIHNKPALTGFAVDSSGKLQKLKITSICSDNPDAFRAWRIWNKNEIDIEFNWDVYGTTQNGSGTAASDGYTYFNTTTVEGANTVRIFVNGSLHDSKISEGAQCSIVIPCIENWTCSNWSECMNENQTRTCNDLNACNTTLNLSAILQACESENPEQNLTLNGTIPAENQTSNETADNETINNQTTNETIINQTDTNQTQNETNLNQTTNETASAEDISENSDAGNSGSVSSSGGHEGGGNSVESNSENSKINETQSAASITIENKTIKSAEGEANSSFLSGEEPSARNLFGILGNAVKIPLAGGKKLFENDSLAQRMISLAFILLAVLSAIFLIKKLIKKSKPAAKITGFLQHKVL